MNHVYDEATIILDKRLNTPEGKHYLQISADFNYRGDIKKAYKAEHQKLTNIIIEFDKKRANNIKIENTENHYLCSYLCCSKQCLRNNCSHCCSIFRDNCGMSIHIFCMPIESCCDRTELCCQTIFEHIYHNYICYKFYNNCCFRYYKKLIKCYNEIFSIIILVSFSIYIFIISIIITFNISYIENILKFSKNTIFSNFTTKNYIYMGFIQGNYELTSIEATQLKTVSIIFNILICILSISLPLIMICIYNCCELKLFTFPMSIICYIIAYILINIQYHIILSLDIITSYYHMTILHIFTGIALIYSLYLIGYFINTK